MNIAVSYGAVAVSSYTHSVSNWRLDGQRLDQVLAAVRAANVKSYDRRNTQHTLSFTNTRPPVSTVVDALLFLASHQAALDATTGVVDVVINLNPGTSTITLKNATLRRVSGRIQGVTTIHDYEFTGGLLVIA